VEEEMKKILVMFLVLPMIITFGKSEAKKMTLPMAGEIDVPDNSNSNPLSIYGVKQNKNTNPLDIYGVKKSKKDDNATLFSLKPTKNKVKVGSKKVKKVVKKDTSKVMKPA
jgi:hypothetical protein